jgi:hypothetical protein
MSWSMAHGMLINAVGDLINCFSENVAASWDKWLQRKDFPASAFDIVRCIYSYLGASGDVTNANAKCTAASLLATLWMLCAVQKGADHKLVQMKEWYSTKCRELTNEVPEDILQKLGPSHLAYTQWRVVHEISEKNEKMVQIRDT